MRKAALALTVGLVAGELLLRFVSGISRDAHWALHPWRPAKIADQRLGTRGDPSFPDHDARGFRNARTLGRADVVALGDSHTYGSGVARSDIWTGELAEALGVTVANLAFPGWGPVQYCNVLDETLALSPQRVIVGFYLGNDLVDAFLMSLTPAGRRLVEPEEESAAATLERAQPIKRATAELAAPQDLDRPLRWPTLLVQLSERSRLAALPRAFAHAMDRRRRARRDPEALWGRWRAFARASPERFGVVDSPESRTILTPAYRALALNPDDPRIALGFEVSCRALAEIDRRCRSSGAALTVMLIPTKERVLEPLVDADGRTDAHRRLLVYESTTCARLLRFLAERKIDAVDAMPALQDAVRRGDRPYFESGDGHPTPAGHHAMARLLASR
jgi:hypothetical protein